MDAASPGGDFEVFGVLRVHIVILQMGPSRSLGSQGHVNIKMLRSINLGHGGVSTPHNQRGKWHIRFFTMSPFYGYNSENAHINLKHTYMWVII